MESRERVFTGVERIKQCACPVMSGSVEDADAGYCRRCDESVVESQTLGEMVDRGGLERRPAGIRSDRSGLRNRFDVVLVAALRHA